jgi:putative flippase GtrA
LQMLKAYIKALRYPLSGRICYSLSRSAKVKWMGRVQKPQATLSRRERAIRSSVIFVIVLCLAVPVVVMLTHTTTKPMLLISLVIVVGFMLSLFRHELMFAGVCSSEIASVRTRGIYELAQLSFLGEMGTNWLVCSTAFRKKITLFTWWRLLKFAPRHIRIQQRAAILGLTLATSAVFSFIWNKDWIFADEPFQTMPLFAIFLSYVLTFMLFVLHEEQQTRAIGAILGMIIPSHTSSPFAAQTVSLVQKGVNRAGDR